MTPYRQAIWPGDHGSDIKAVKRAMRVMGLRGSGGLVVDNRAGPQFVIVLNRFLTAHGLRADSKYGPQAHAIIAAHFDLYGVSLYKAAKIRVRTPPPIPVWGESARQAAQDILVERSRGNYRADNPGDLRDLEATAAGQHVWSQCGYWVFLDPRPLRLVLWLIRDRGFKVGTYAFCSDHGCDGPHGHGGGLAVDISSLNDEALAAPGERVHADTVSAVTAIRDDANARPWQLISDGTGNVRRSDLEALCIPSAAFYGEATLAQHRGHIHVGYR